MFSFAIVKVEESLRFLYGLSMYIYTILMGNSSIIRVHLDRVINLRGGKLYEAKK